MEAPSFGAPARGDPDARPAAGSGENELHASPAPDARSARGPLALRLGLWAAASVAAYFGWRAFDYLCDDAYITFRYVANAMEGYGYVWNGPPFRPVEGYTSFSWTVLLHVIWTVTGLAPPDVASQLGYVFGVLTLGRVVQLLGVLDRRHVLPALIALAGIVSNRTFLAWITSGLETSLYTFLLLTWVWHTLRERSWGQSVTATLLALTRPDGLLVVAFTVGHLVWRRRWVAMSPLAVVAAHILWRRATYGFFVPNTAAAKIVNPDPWWGPLYAGSFILEYGWWIAAFVWTAWVARLARRARRPPLGALVVAGALAGSFAVYTFRLGGDHFEYRVYHHLVPLGWIALVGALRHLDARPAVASAVLALQLAVSLPIPWVHWSRAEAPGNAPIDVPVADALPWVPYAAAFDRWQAYLHQFAVNIRYHEHVEFMEIQDEELAASAEDGRGWVEPGEDDDVPVRREGTVGLYGWRMPHVAIVDSLGLNDAVVAHNPRLRSKVLMAHRRQPPKGYVECLNPNVEVEGRRVVIRPRDTPLKPADVRACEDRYWTKFGLPEPWF